MDLTGTAFFLLSDGTACSCQGTCACRYSSWACSGYLPTCSLTRASTQIAQLSVSGDCADTTVTFGLLPLVGAVAVW